MFKNLDFSPGIITYDDFNIDKNAPLEKQIFSLKQDLFQVDYDGKYTIDIGWYPDFDPNGSFIICVIKEHDWDNPLYRKKTNNLMLLSKFVEESIELVKNL